MDAFYLDISNKITIYMQMFVLVDVIKQFPDSKDMISNFI